jgi:hypothetical protein
MQWPENLVKEFTNEIVGTVGLINDIGIREYGLAVVPFFYLKVK